MSDQATERARASSAAVFALPWARVVEIVHVPHEPLAGATATPSTPFT